jgi:hypothetical protein
VTQLKLSLSLFSSSTAEVPNLERERDESKKMVVGFDFIVAIGEVL